MDNSPKKRNELASRLKTAGCPINLTGTDWHTAGDLRAPEANAEIRPALDSAPGMSAEAKQLLLASAEDPTGTVLRVDTNEGLIVSTNKTGFAEGGNPRSQATWRAAVDELVKAGLLVPLSSDVLEVTHQGYEIAERIRPSKSAAPSGRHQNAEGPKRSKAQQHDYELAKKTIAESGQKAIAVLKFVRMHGEQTFGNYGPAQLPDNVSGSEMRNILDDLARRGLITRRDVQEPRNPHSVYDIAAPMKEILEELLYEDGAGGPG
jgi:hypothetical protein